MGGNVIMEVIDGRGISNGNDVYFIYDAENDVVVMATYRDVPGVRSDLLKPNIIKAFTKDEWGEINEFLSAGVSEHEYEEEGEEEYPPVPLTANIAAKDIELPKVNSIPSMTANDAPEEDSVLMDIEDESGETDK
jgi:hypothetical protein